MTQPRSNSANRVTVLTPVFNDWDCLEPFLSDLASVLEPDLRISVVVVNDGSTDPVDLDSITVPEALDSVEILQLGCNLGHQRAIAVGLVELAGRDAADVVIVIDADGEDRPSDVARLWQAHRDNPEAIVVAQRQQRTEAVRFRLFYALYKVLFRLLTGRELDFGNFSLVPLPSVQRLSLMPELWNHYPACVMRSCVPIVRVPLDRGTRYAGRSRMNFTSLVNHGLAGISAFIDTAFVRLLVLSMTLMTVFGLVALGGVVLRLSTSVPIPGWAALGASVALIALVQVIAALIVVSFLTLSSRSTPSPPPVRTTPVYVANTVRVR